MFVCVPHTHDACEVQEKTSDALGLELHMVVSHHMGTGD